ncbi:hypothetical protein, partial [Bordetella hinzii]|uniref:hypothetical protein n=1 Tax=Bordetella hinzii TaxID=103855 RepID=UPI001E2ACD44
SDAALEGSTWTVKSSERRASKITVTSLRMEDLLEVENDGPPQYAEKTSLALSDRRHCLTSPG